MHNLTSIMEGCVDPFQDSYYKFPYNNCIAEVYCGNSATILPSLKPNSVDLIITSPPYASQRQGDYGGTSPEKYVEWFLPISSKLFRVLKPEGSFILNIKEHAANGERSTYVLELILALRKQGWLWTEEYIWHKKTAAPGKWPNRFRDAWERLLHFNKQRQFVMYQEEVMVPMGEWAKKRMSKLTDEEKVRSVSATGSGFSKHLSKWEGRDKAYPTNVLHLAPTTGNKNHSATFPNQLPEWFIKLFTKPGDLVLDPFLGSGTTSVVSLRLGRNSIGIELNEEYFRLACENILSCKPT